MKLEHCKQHAGSDDDSLNCYRIRHDDGRPASDYEVMSHIYAQAAEIAALRADAGRYLYICKQDFKDRQWFGSFDEYKRQSDACIDVSMRAAMKEQP